MISYVKDEFSSADKAEAEGLVEQLIESSRVGRAEAPSH